MIRWVIRLWRKCFRAAPPAPSPREPTLNIDPKQMRVLQDWNDEMERRALRQDPSGSTITTVMASNIVRMIAFTDDPVNGIRNLYLKDKA